MASTILRDKDIVIPAGTTAQRPSTPSEGNFRFNTDSGTKVIEFYNGTRWVQHGKRDGSTQESAAYSGWHLKQQFPNLPSGYYWIQNDRMPNPLQMYVNMTRDGGGYDFYAVTAGTAVTKTSEAHSGVALGLDLVYPRSAQHWIAMREFVVGVLGQSASAYLKAFPITQYTRAFNGAPVGNYEGTYGSDAGNYTSYIMRDPTYYGSGAPDWKVPDGGRWWVRNTTFAEPNGDYDANGFLNYAIPDAYNGEDISFNDGGAYTTGTSYLVSTNMKP